MQNLQKIDGKIGMVVFYPNFPAQPRYNNKRERKEIKIYQRIKASKQDQRGNVVRRDCDGDNYLRSSSGTAAPSKGAREVGKTGRR